MQDLECAMGIEGTWLGIDASMPTAYKIATPNQQPRIVSQNGLRSFACSPVSVVVLVVNDQEQFLFGHHRTRQRWEAVSGALEAEESVLVAATQSHRR